MPEEDAGGGAAPGKPAPHFHLIDTQIGQPVGYREEVYLSRRAAEAAARARVRWLAAVAGLRVDRLAGTARYLLTTGAPGDAGRVIEVEECDDPECIQREYDSLC